jgi:predicted SAM-dependent methyltransferase
MVRPAIPLNRRTIDILRHESRALFTRFLNALNPVYHVTVHRLRQQQDLSLNLGSGGKGLANWVNVELIRARDTTLCLDIRRKLPLADNSVGRISCEHVVEHLDFREDIPAVLADWFRVLRPGGIVRIIVPDAKAFLEAYVAGDRQQWLALNWDPQNLPHDIYTPMHIINHTFHQEGEHLFAYDAETLKWSLQQAGFVDFREMSFRQSSDPALALDQENHAPYSLYAEARKP